MTEQLTVRDIRLPKALREELDMLLYQVKNEGMDLLIVIDGKEGVGKTRTERLIGAYCADKLGTPFGVDNIHYSTEDYMKASEKMGRFTVHCLDEAGVILHRASSNTRVARRFTKYLQVAREGNNQVHIITLPAYHILDGYVVNWRCKFVLHMYGEKIDDPNAPSGKRIKRGAFKVYPNNDFLTECWNLHQALKVFRYPKGWYIHDRMPDCEPFTPSELDDLLIKKLTWRKKFIDDEQKPVVDKPLDKAAISRNKLLGKLNEQFGLDINPQTVSDFFGVSASHSYKIVQEYNRVNQ